MLAVGLLFIAWALLRPLSAELEESEQSGGGSGGDGGRRRRVAAAAGRSSASTAPPKPPPIIRAPAAPARLSRSTVASTSGTEAS